MATPNNRIPSVASCARAERIRLGSFYTPPKYVSLIGEWLRENGCADDWTIADLSCGDGAFLTLERLFPNAAFFGNDIDPKACETARRNFPTAQISDKNCLLATTRAAYGLPESRPLAIVGNPPYNDTGSLVGRKAKRGNPLPKIEIAPEIRCRDLGLSAPLCYDRMQAELVAVLHPLSYLLKEANFAAGERFFQNYTLAEHLVFSSQVFQNTSKCAAFPVIAALYRRNPKNGMTRNAVEKMRFVTEEGLSFRLDDWDFIGKHIRKYPHKNRYSPEILFYTQRDVNALFRSKTFLTRRSPNAVDVPPELLPYYCYLDCFKNEFKGKLPYWAGNLDAVPFHPELFAALKEIAVADAKARHPEIFGEGSPPPSEKELARLREGMQIAPHA